MHRIAVRREVRYPGKSNDVRPPPKITARLLYASLREHCKSQKFR
jgi:hypothetical protein